MKFRFFLMLTVLVLAAVPVRYFHWDAHLLQVLREARTPEAKRLTSIWLNRYRADIQDKPVERLLKAETSGLTWHEPSNSLFVITGKIPKLAQLSLAGDLLREIELVGVSDPESIEALSDGRFALVEERRARLIIFSLPADNRLDLTDALQVDLGVLNDEFLYPKNKGIEGLIWDAAHSRFILGKEREPHALYALAFDLASNRAGELTALSTDRLSMRDISGLELGRSTGHLLVLSDESKLVMELDETGDTVSFMSLMSGFNGLERGIEQAEGLAMDDKGVIYIVGEPNLFYRFVPDAH